MTHGKPPPLQRDKCRASCLRHACVVPATCVLRREDDGRPPPPPTHPRPPRVGDAGRGGRKAPPPPGDKAAGWGGSGERVRDGPHDRARREHTPCKPQRGDHRECERRVEKATTGATRHAPPPPCTGTGAAPRACTVLASCLRHACKEGKTTSPPPPTHTSAPPRVGDEGREGRTAPPPPEDKAARWGGSGERVRDGPHDRARRKHAPCKPRRGGHRGCERRVGRATTGAKRHAPPPPAEGQVPRLVPVPCLRRAYAKGRTARTPPPPTPFSPTHTGKGREQRGDGEGTWGGAEDGPTATGRDWRRAVEAQKKNKQRTKQTNAPGEESEEAGTKTATYGGRPGRHGPARDAGEVPDLGPMGAPKEKPPPPTAAKCLTPYLRRACDMRATKRRRQAPPPPPHTPPPPRGWGMAVAERGPPPPPEGKAAGWGGSGERVRDGPDDRAQREHAPCKPQRGDHRGCDRRVGRATTGATRQAPPPTCRGTSAAPRACTVLATCLHHRTGSEETPPPHLLLLHPPKKGEGTARRQRGDMGQRTN